MTIKSDDCLVSVITGAHNRKAYVIKSINSVINSKYKNIEIIYVDSKSNDRTVETVKTMFPFVKILSTDNKNVTITRNLGGSVAKGTILLFLDSDAELIPGTIEKAIDEFINDPDLGVIGTKIVSIDDRYTVQGKPIKFLVPLFFPSSKHVKIDNKQYAFQVLETCFFTTKDVFDVLKGFDEDLYAYGQDGFDYCWRTWKLGKKVLYIPNTTYHKGFGSNPDASDRYTIEKNIVESGANQLLIYIKNSDLTTFIQLPIIFIFIISYIIKRNFITSTLSVINLFFKKVKLFIKKRSSKAQKWKMSDRNIFKYICKDVK